MDKRNFNLGLNELKDRYPEKLIMIESIQRAFNRDVKCIDKGNLRALYQNPSQFMMKINTDDGEWTTMLHKWADNGLEDLLNIDPLYLITKNSYGDTVLMNLIQYALGDTTEQINYDLLKNILSKPLVYKYRTGNGDEFLEGCVWDECDISGKTPIDYLKDMATGKGSCVGCMPITELLPLIQEWSNNRMAMMQTVEEPEQCEDEEYCDDYPDEEELDDGNQVTATDLIDEVIEDECDDYPDELLDEEDIARAEDMAHEQIQKSPELSETDIFAALK